MYNNPSYQSPPESCPSPRGETQPGDLARSHGRTRTRAAASDFGAGGRAGPCWLRDSRRLQPSRGATHSGPGRGPAPSPPPRLPSAFLTRNPEAKKKQPSGRRVSIHSPVRLSVRPSIVSMLILPPRPQPAPVPVPGVISEPRGPGRAPWALPHHDGPAWAPTAAPCAQNGAAPPLQNVFLGLCPGDGNVGLLGEQRGGLQTGGPLRACGLVMVWGPVMVWGSITV